MSTVTTPIPPVTPLRVSGNVALVALLVVLLLTHAPTLPILAWPALVIAGTCVRLPIRRWTAVARIVVLIAIYVALALSCGWFASDTLRVAVLAVLLLKWAESRSVAEEALVTAAALVAVAIGSLNWNEDMALLWVALALVTALLALGERATGNDVPFSTTWRTHGTRLGGAILRALRQLALALPLAGVLFVFFPRIPGPLWDIGLSFGLPLAIGIDESPQGLGISASLKPGQTQAGAEMVSATPVLVAEFENWVPPTSQLYWRGPVFYDFDGEEWKLNSDIATSGRRFMPQGWRSARAFEEEQLDRKSQQINYTIRLSPHKATWLYALDLPAALPTEAFIGPDWQVISHMPVEREMNYKVASWLEWTAKPEIRPEVRERALILPPFGNPRLRQLGERLRGAQNADTADAIIRAGLTEVVRGGFSVRDTFEVPQGPDAFDTFWFDTHTGNAEFFAGAFVYLMRATGVPARLVTGYRGGKLMALTDYVVVKRSHAHAWVEVWDDIRGWKRIDPVDTIAPQNVTSTSPKAKERTEPAETSPAPEEAARKQASQPVPNGGFAERAPSALLKLKHADDMPSLLDVIGTWIGHWIVRLDAERQLEVLAGKGGGFAWVWLLLGAVFAATTIAFAAIGLTRWRDTRRLPPAQRAWQRVCGRLARMGLPITATECPNDYARRVGKARPELAAGVRTLAEAYVGWRYGRTPDQWPSIITKAARYLINRIQAMPTGRSAQETENP